MMTWMTAIRATMLMAAFEMISWRTKPRRALNGLRDDLDAALINAASGAGSGGGPGNGSGGGNQFTQIAAGSALATILGSVGTSFDLFFDTAGTGAAPSLTDAIAAGFSNFAPNLGNAVLSQSVGSISNFLTGELSASLGLGHDAACPGRRYNDNAMRSPARELLPHGDSRVVARGRAGASFDDYSANFAHDAANDNPPTPLALAS